MNAIILREILQSLRLKRITKLLAICINRLFILSMVSMLTSNAVKAATTTLHCTLLDTWFLTQHRRSRQHAAAGYSETCSLGSACTYDSSGFSRAEKSPLAPFCLVSVVTLAGFRFMD
jgi:hypothetical protein